MDTQHSSRTPAPTKLAVSLSGEHLPFTTFVTFECECAHHLFPHEPIQPRVLDATLDAAGDSLARIHMREVVTHHSSLTDV